MSKPDQRQKSYEKLLRAGYIAAEALRYTCNLVNAGELLYTIAEKGEEYIRKLGGQPAFPINLSIDHHAAHYTPPLTDPTVVPKKALVKVDLGAHVDGHIADNARTVLVGDDDALHRLITAAETGVQAAIQTIRAGIRVWTVSKSISNAIRKLHASPIENLTGHSIEPFNLHAGVSVPAITRSHERYTSPRLQEHMVIAIEPFTTYSRNPIVDNLEAGHIFGFTQTRNPQSSKLRSLFSQMKVKFGQLPFASRWMRELVEPKKIPSILNRLQNEGCIHNYPILGLRDKKPIAQAEHTVIVQPTGCIVTTLQTQMGGS
ncbi:MAG: type II methionyl aminopeptidase [Candidatus Hodarchaeota archaeon]